MMRRTRGCAAVLALGACLGTATPARAGYLEDAGWGTLTVLTNVVYMPAKITYAVLGGLTGGFAFALTGGAITFAGTPGGDADTGTTADGGTPQGLHEQSLGSGTEPPG